MMHRSFATPLRHRPTLTQTRPITKLHRGVVARAGVRQDQDRETSTGPLPPRTVAEAVGQARAALRAFRDQQQQQQQQQQLPLRLTIELPLPADRSSILGADEGRALVRALDESDWPGGSLQRFRALKPLVGELLEGYGTKFLGMLEDESDGLGCWSLPDMTLAGFVTSATVPAFLKLAEGGYGSRVTAPGHALVAVNPAWGSARDVGQPWQRDLKERAAALLEGTKWEALYCCRFVRTGYGTTGLLLRAWPHPWALYAMPLEDASEVGPLLLVSQPPHQPPTRAAIVGALEGVKEEMKQQAEAIERQRNGGVRWPWQ